MSLLRASSFCRRNPHHHRQQQTTHSTIVDDDSYEKDETIHCNLTNDDDIVLPVIILSQQPPRLRRRRQQQYHQDDDNDPDTCRVVSTVDPFATVYVSDNNRRRRRRRGDDDDEGRDFFVSHSLIENKTMAFIRRWSAPTKPSSFRDDDEDDGDYHPVFVARYFPVEDDNDGNDYDDSDYDDCYNVESDDDDDDDCHDDDNDGDLPWSNNNHTLHIPPCLAYTMGLHDFVPEQHVILTVPTLDYDDDYDDDSKYHRLHYQRRHFHHPRIGDEMHVREIGRRPQLPRFLSWSFALDSDDERRQRQTKEEETERCSLQNYFRRGGKSVERLLRCGSVFAVGQRNREWGEDEDGSIDGDNRDCHYDGNVRFYQVVKIHSHDDNNSDEDKRYYFISPRTKMILLPSHNHHNDDDNDDNDDDVQQQAIITRLPRPSKAASYYHSIFSNEPLKGDEKPPAAHYHPSLNQVIDGLLHDDDGGGGGGMSRYEVVNVVGGEENDIMAVVSEAADIVGKRYIPIHGLAALAYQSHPTTPVTGSLRDKLSGLATALSLARSSSPSILHIFDCHQDMDNDHQQSDDNDDDDDDLRRFAAVVTASQRRRASVVTILLTTPHEPLSEKARRRLLSTPESIIRIDGPDERYASRLWDDPTTFSSLRPHVESMTADDVRRIKRDFFSSTRDDGDDAIINRLVQNLPSSSSSSSSLPTIPTTTWSDVGGLHHVRRAVSQCLVLPSLYPHHLRRSGLLLYGPPGTGKTLVAKAIASEYELPFFSVKGPELLGSYVGESEENVRGVFETARGLAEENKGGILFFDEIDSLAPSRQSDGGGGGGGGVMDRVVTTLLNEFDKTEKGGDMLFVVGATNRPDLLDKALLRPGRFSRLVYLGVSEEEEDIVRILKACTRKFTLGGGDGGSGWDWGRAVRDAGLKTKRLTGADLAAVSRNALMKALKRKCGEVDKEAERRGVTVNQVMEQWKEEGRLVPIVKERDLVEAGRETKSSVGEEDLRRYELLKKRFG